jgi:choline-sulfatase
MYDHSIRVPTAVCWPGVIEPGTKITQSIYNLDWFPTLLAMAGVDLPKNVTTRGRNFLPLLKGKSPDWENGFYAQYSTHHQSKTHMRMYRTPNWKLIVDFNDSTRDELYSLKTDSEERENLIESKDPNV